jgi:hypothetical protein
MPTIVHVGESVPALFTTANAEPRRVQPSAGRSVPGCIYALPASASIWQGRTGEAAPTFYGYLDPIGDGVVRRNSSSDANTAAAAFLRELTPSRRKTDERCVLIVLSERQS